MIQLIIFAVILGILAAIVGSIPFFGWLGTILGIAAAICIVLALLIGTGVLRGGRGSRRRGRRRSSDGGFFDDIGDTLDDIGDFGDD